MEGQPQGATWTERQRLLSQVDYLSAFLFGLLNPVVRTMRGVCAATQLPRVQEQICGRPVSLASFSEAQALVDPQLLAEVFGQLSAEVADQPATPRDARRWFVQDGSLFEALPRMHWALWRRQGTTQAQVRLHLSLDLASASPARAVVTPGKTCERAVWRTQWQRGDAYVADTYFGEDYRLFWLLDHKAVSFVVRLRDEALIQVEQELPLSAADRSAGVVRTASVRLGAPQRRSMRVRLVTVQTPGGVLLLVTNLGAEELSAADVALLYKQRWHIELFFRWIKCLFGCRHWLAESAPGAALQLYLALIAALLLQLYTGTRPNRRMFELIQFYLLGVATLDDLCAGLDRERRQLARRKKA